MTIEAIDPAAGGGRITELLLGIIYSCITNQMYKNAVGIRVLGPSGIGRCFCRSRERSKFWFGEGKKERKKEESEGSKQCGRVCVSFLTTPFLGPTKV